MWNYLQFPIGYPLIKIDLPGHGKSKDPSFVCDSIEETAKAVIGVLNELRVDEYHLIGHSMGGYVGLEMKRMDERQNKMMFLNSNFWSDSPQKVEDRKRVAQIVQTNQSHFVYEVIPNLFLHPEKCDLEVKALIAEAMEMSPEAIASASIAMSRRKDYTDFFRENSTDFTIVQGLDDAVVPSDQMRALVAGTSARFIELTGVGHMAHIESPDRVNQLIEEFLQ